MKITYAVYWKTFPNQFDPEPVWHQFSCRYEDYNEALNELKMVKQNPRCNVAKIVEITETIEDVPGTEWSRI